MKVCENVSKSTFKWTDKKKRKKVLIKIIPLPPISVKKIFLKVVNKTKISEVNFTRKYYFSFTTSKFDV